MCGSGIKIGSAWVGMKFSNLGEDEDPALGWKVSPGMEKQHLFQTHKGVGGNSRRELLGVGRRNGFRVSGSGVFIAEKRGSLLVKACLWGLDTWKKKKHCLWTVVRNHF